MNGVCGWLTLGWIGDEVCPDKFARQLVDGLEQAEVAHKAMFVDAGHRASSDGIKLALQQCVQEFLER